MPAIVLSMVLIGFLLWIGDNLYTIDEDQVYTYFKCLILQSASLIRTFPLPSKHFSTA